MKFLCLEIKNEFGIYFTKAILEFLEKQLTLGFVMLLNIEKHEKKHILRPWEKKRPTLSSLGKLKLKTEGIKAKFRSYDQKNSPCNAEIDIDIRDDILMLKMVRYKPVNIDIRISSQPLGTDSKLSLQPSCKPEISR